MKRPFKRRKNVGMYLIETRKLARERARKKRGTPPSKYRFEEPSKLRLTYEDIFNPFFDGTETALSKFSSGRLSY